MEAAALPAQRSARLLRPSIGKALVTLPGVAWVLALVVAPNLFLLFNSLWTNDLGTITHTWTFDNYHQVADSEVVRTLFFRTLYVAVTAAALATLIAYPAAYFVVRRFSRHRLTLALLVLVPLWIGLLMRVFAWRIILGREGVLSGLLQTLGLTNEPSGALLYSTKSVIIALTYIAIPYVFIVAFTTLERIPDSLFEAAADAGASGWKTFTTVAWPLSRPAVAIGFGMAFIIAFSDYVTPQLVGGFKGTMLGSIVLQEVGLNANFPRASALAMVILVGSAMVLLLISLVGRSEARFE
jgi:ABC-type spermidine/putrescine transport system permease subunit I